MHINSLQSYHEEKKKLSRRARDILSFLEQNRGSYTDRQIMERMGFGEPNAVRPRITEMIRSGFLEEAGNTRCPVTKKHVRLVRIRARSQGQMEMEI